MKSNTVFVFRREDCRPFNLEHARAGAPLCMRKGDRANVIKWDMNNQFPIVATFVEEGIEWVGTWYSDGSYSKNEEGELPKDLVMLPLGYLDGRPVHVGDVLISGVNTPGFEYSFTVGPDMIGRFLNCKWPEPDDYEHDEPDTITLTKSDIQHVVWAYKQLSEEIHRFESAEHVSALREIAVKHGDLKESDRPRAHFYKGDMSLKPLHDYQQAAVDNITQSTVAEIMPDHEIVMVVGTGNPGAIIDDEPKASIDFIDTILPKDFPVKFAAPVEPVVVDTSKAPPVAVPDEDKAEKAFWTFDAMRKGYAQWKARPQSERDAFKFIYVSALHTAEHWRQMYEGVLAINVQRDDQIRKLTEANAALEDRNRAHLEDNAKLDKALDEQMTETGRWMFDAKSLGARCEGYNNRINELGTRLSNIAAYVRNDAAAVTFQNMSSYRAAVLSKVLD